MLAASVPAGVLVEDPTVRWRPEASVTGLAVGDRIDVDAATFGALAEAFLDEIEKRFPEA